MAEKTLVLVDGSSYLFRAYHALPLLTNSKGEYTNAILGVTNMLKKLVETYPEAYFGVIFDAPGKTFRNDMYPEYKANRASMPDELREQIKPLHQLIKAMGLPLVMEPGVEADDVIGTLAKQAEEEDLNVVISTGDKDIAQLVTNKTSLINTMNNQWLDEEGVKEKFGVPPDMIIDYLALMGDTSDNIPGVPKVGPKTAAKWLNAYGSLDEIIAKADEVKGKVGESLRDHLDAIPLSKELVTIKCDVPLDKAPADLIRTQPDTETLKEMVSHYEFNSWLKQLGGTKASTVASEQVDEKPLPAKTELTVETILDEATFNQWLAKLTEAELFAFDTETTHLDYTKALVVGVSFAIEAGHAAYVPLAHSYPGAPQQLSRQWVLDQLKPLLESESARKVGQNLKYDANVLANHGISLAGIYHDTMLQSYVLNSTASRHNMDALAEKYLGQETIHYEDVAGKGAKQICFDQVSIELAAPYAAEDADITLRLHQHIFPQLKKIDSLATVYETIEMPLVPVLARMEQTGVLVDEQMLSQQSGELTASIKALETQAHEAAGQAFNLGSPKQIQEILYDKLGLPVLKKTPKGQPSTAESVLQDLAVDFPLPRLILEHRSLSKLRSTYTDKLPKQINPVTGRVHTSYHQAVAATGRLSSSDPNLQNIPVRSEEGRRIRQAFIAEEGFTVMAADYSQIELRIMAHLSQDTGLLQAFKEGLDVHKATAAEVFGVPVDQVETHQRRSAKAINFGLIYGMSAFGLAKQLDIDRGAAQGYINLYFERYPGVKQYMDETRELAREQGYIETLFGRRLYLPDILAKNGQRRQYAERTAINAPMQGTAADIIKLAMLSVDNWLQVDKPAVRMVMQVHDELVFEVENSYLDQAASIIQQKMSGAASLDVPLVVDVGMGKNWDEAH
ncbi:MULTISPECIES: DNA polymerase I [Cycloclasticus]|uniref:DNA polymerase I n=1 Tax=Cycloclasticus pugetii TaxID=34068 RepID=A0AB33Z245_9GAMM|nr:MULTISPECIES: DNA polymerase I [Cycloclasticus]ATI01986.1 DNA polymerase I [Cycloclasticus sp. PY97N]EPD13272.1 DNA polymerase I [Cycloclasticus pugetii]